MDFGPGAGDRGGEITAQGTPKQVTRAKNSLTGQYLSGRRAITIPSNRRMQSAEGSVLTHAPSVPVSVAGDVNGALRKGQGRRGAHEAGRAEAQQQQSD